MSSFFTYKFPSGTVQLNMNNGSIVFEALCSSAGVTPGLFMIPYSVGQPDGDGWGLVSGAYPTRSSVIAIEVPYFGKTIDDIYEEGDRVFMRGTSGGDFVWAWLAANETCIIGQPMYPSIGGVLKPASAVAPEELMIMTCLAAESVISSDPSPTRLIVTIL